MEAQLIHLGNDFPFYVASYNGVPSGEYEARFIYKEIFGDSCYDDAQLSHPRLIVDVGANIGLFTVYLKKKYPDCKLLAFEPAPDTFKILTKNVALHKLEGVEILQLALGPMPAPGC